ncbi:MULTISPECIES: hypothetical protein, partial [unclassified Sphingomonas]|uniref:hypothetical protein n=1 Tax=unclassified Sphingomonas TaxID=196159 RepID=UPI00226AFC19
MIIFLLLLAMQFGADEDAVRGATSVGDQLSAGPSFRREGHTSVEFAIGASLQAWLNASVAVERVAKHTNDPAQIAAICSQEADDFQTLGIYASGVNPSVAVMQAGLPSRVASDWYRRRRGKPKEC